MAGVLVGDLAHFYPTEVLQFLQLAEATGRLVLERAGERAELHLDRGRPVFARTSGGSVRLGEMLVHRGAIASESLEQALDEQRHQPTMRLGALLVSSGRVAREPVVRAVQDCLQRVVYGLMLWGDGRFEFEPAERAVRDDLQPDLELDRMIVEGLRQADEARHTA